MYMELVYYLLIVHQLQIQIYHQLNVQPHVQLQKLQIVQKFVITVTLIAIVEHAL